MTADWNFFATAHGKGPCDALGGTTKRLARTASLQGSKIETAAELYDWCSTNIHNVHYMLISDAKVQEVVETINLTKRYEELSTVAGTKQAHRIKIQNGKISLFETSLDKLPFVVREIQSSLPPMILEACSINDWVACIYNSKWCLAKIDEVDLEEDEIKVSFWKRNVGPKGGTSFVPENTSCYVPVSSVLKKLSPPKSSRTSRFVTITHAEQQHLAELEKLYLQ